MNIIYYLSLTVFFLIFNVPVYGIAEEKEDIASMAHIPAGEFWLYHGYPRNVTLLTYLDAYDMDIFEVSVADYAACVEAGACSDAPFERYMLENKITGYPIDFEATRSKAKQDLYPMRYVTFQESAAYCAFLGKRLPTDAEWTKASRGEGYPWDDLYKYGVENQEENCKNSNVNNCIGHLLETNDKRYPPSPYGIYHLFGNISERILDINVISHKNALRNPLFTEELFKQQPPRQKGMFINLRLSVGGNFLSPGLSRYARDNEATEKVGFRCVRSKLMKPEDFNK